MSRVTWVPARGLSIPGMGAGHARIEHLIERLEPYMPRFHDRRFWIVQGVVVLVGGLHRLVELLLGAPGTERLDELTFVPVALFLIPVVYAALNFGLAGSIATALWCTALTVGDALICHEGIDQFVEAVQIVIVDGIAVFVGHRVDQETSARRRLEAATAALEASETKYRGLFESSPAAILVLDMTGTIVEASPAAGGLFGKAPASLRGLAVATLIGCRGAKSLFDSARGNGRAENHLILRPRERPDKHLFPIPTWAIDEEGRSVMQVLLEDVTEDLHREAGLRAYAAQVLQAQEDERKRIAEELHDETLQQLILLCRELDIAEMAAVKTSPAIGERLRAVRESAEDVAAGLRTFARTLRPPILDDLGLVACVRRLLMDLTERTNIAGKFKVTGNERRLLPDVELGLFRIAQEALRNVERHSRATQVSVLLAFRGEETSLEVVDNGIGFAAPPGLDIAASGHLGLLGMRERAELVGGRFEIHSAPGGGTSVVISAPISVVPDIALAAGGQRAHQTNSAR